MSESELSDAPSAPTPSDAELKASLRTEVRKADKAGDDVTVRKVREASIRALGLPEGFYTDGKWKAISKEVIHAEYDKIQNGDVQSPKPAAKPKPTQKRSAKQTPWASTAPPKKRRKKSSSDVEPSASSSEQSDVDHDVDDKKTKKGSESAPKPAKTPQSAKVTAQPSKVKKPESEDEDAAGSAEEEVNKAATSDSEMSVVLDDEPPKKQRSQTKDSRTISAKQSNKAKPKSAVDDDPEKEEIKKLQGWLVKCGVRKVWSKELKPYETSKAKIKHLKDMLTDVGMTGRFSTEKAAQIREARELAADIEAVQEGAQRWGKDEDPADDGDNRTRGGRRLVRGSMNYDFLSSDGEETD